MQFYNLYGSILPRISINFSKACIGVLQSLDLKDWRYVCIEITLPTTKIKVLDDH